VTPQSLTAAEQSPTAQANDPFAILPASSFSVHCFGLHIVLLPAAYGVSAHFCCVCDAQSADPSAMPLAGGVPLRLSGAGLSQAVRIFIGGRVVSSFTVESTDAADPVAGVATLLLTAPSRNESGYPSVSVLFPDAQQPGEYWAARRDNILFYTDTSCNAPGSWLQNGACVPWCAVLSALLCRSHL
jgi:hypothetical protein